MVDQVYGRTPAPLTPIASAARVAPPQKVQPTTPAATQAAAAAPSLARTMAASAPIDADRVAQIKSAIADGRFPLSPSTIADALVALKYEWMSNDEA